MWASAPLTYLIPNSPACTLSFNSLKHPVSSLGAPHQSVKQFVFQNTYLKPSPHPPNKPQASCLIAPTAYTCSCLIHFSAPSHSLFCSLGWLMGSYSCVASSAGVATVNTSEQQGSSVWVVMTSQQTPCYQLQEVPHEALLWLISHSSDEATRPRLHHIMITLVKIAPGRPQQWQNPETCRAKGAQASS